MPLNRQPKSCEYVLRDLQTDRAVRGDDDRPRTWDNPTQAEEAAAKVHPGNWGEFWRVSPARIYDFR